MTNIVTDQLKNIQTTRWDWLKQAIDTFVFADDCVEWQWGKSSAGYGKVQNPDIGKVVYVHRAAFSLYWKQTIPDNLHCCHKCDNPSCFNPLHIFLGDDQVNHADKVAKNRHPKGENAAAAKLTEAQIFEIFPLKGQVPSKEVAKLYGVHPRHIREIWAGKTIWLKEYNEYVARNPEYPDISPTIVNRIIRRDLTCVNCLSHWIRKDGICQGRQKYQCGNCQRKFSKPIN